MSGNEIDRVFKALADPSRRELLDRLHARNGQTLGELSQGLRMARQSVTQHLDLLEEANLLSVQWRGRERLHFFNPVPIHDIYERWIRKFEGRRLSALRNFKLKLERSERWEAISSSTSPTSPPPRRSSGRPSSRAS
jgi:DNA-binding transcriptional ArsR family regulator